MKISTAQHSTAQHSTAQHSTEQHYKKQQAMQTSKQQQAHGCMKPAAHKHAHQQQQFTTEAA